MMAQDSAFTLNTTSATATPVDPGVSEAQQLLEAFWPKVVEEIKSNQDFKTQELPLARIKKIMKLDDDVKSMMISAEAPVLFAKAAEMFITELSLRAWIHTEDNKRRTLQRNDIAMAITKYDQFDFLIDIVPRDEIKPQAKRTSSLGSMETNTMSGADQVQYLIQNPFQQSCPGQFQVIQTPTGLQIAPLALGGQPLIQLVPNLTQDTTSQLLPNVSGIQDTNPAQNSFQAS